MKRLLFLIVCLVALFGLSSCQGVSNVSVGEVINNSEISMSSRYTLLTGVQTKTITLLEETSVKVEIVTESGKIGLVIKSDETNYYNGSDLETCSFEVVLQPGTYEISITAKKHKGSYKIIW